MVTQNRLFALAEYSLSEIAQQSGISVGYLSLILSGKRKNVSLAVLARLAFALDIPVHELKRWIMEGPEKGTSLQENQDRGHKPEEKEKIFQDLILRTLEALEHFDTDQLKELRREAEALSVLHNPHQPHLLYWINGILEARKNLFQQALGSLGKARSFKPTTSLERRMLAKIHGGLGSCYIALGNHKMALKMLSKSLNIWGRGTDAALIYLNLGTLYRRAHQYRYSRQAYLQALEMGSLFIQIMAYSGLGQVLIDQKDLGGARIHLLSGYKLSRRQPTIWGVPELYCNLGVLYNLSGQYNKAKVILIKALRQAERIGAVRVKHYILLELGEILSLLMQTEQANEVFLQLEQEFSDVGDLFLLGKTLLKCAQNSWKAKEVALDFLLRSYRVLGQLEPSEELRLCCQLLVECYNRCGAPESGDFYRDEVKRMKRKF